MSDIPFQVGSRLTLESDWTLPVQQNRISDRIWEAAGFSLDPDYLAANARWKELIAEKHSILERRTGPTASMELWDGSAYTTKQIGTKAAPGDTKRMKAVDQELEALWEPIFQSKVTLPKGTSIEIALITPLPNFSAGVVRFNVTSTTHPGLLTKKEGGSLRNGKRVFLIHGGDFEVAKYQVATF